MSPELDCRKDKSVDRMGSSGRWQRVATPQVNTAMRPPVVEHLAATPRKAVVAALGTRAPRRFSAAMFIGRKLRALYDDDEQPCPSRLTELLRALDDTTRPGERPVGSRLMPER